VFDSAAFRRAAASAARAVGSNGRFSRLLGQAAARLDSPSAALTAVTDDVRALLRMVREAALGHYRRLPKRALLAVAAGLLYLVDPLDLIPDMVPVIGLLDDATVLLWVVHQVRRDLDDYLAWEREWGGAIDVEPIPDAPEPAQADPRPLLPAE
jgi:uncharacterized membrane protein YkvA (DUF1232 family)